MPEFASDGLFHLRKMFQRSVTRRTIAEGWICISCRRHQAKLSKRVFSSRVDDPGVKQDGRLTRNQILPSKPARTRFAPSPTGYMHIGGLRTALFSYLLAKKTGGQFLLRIEDTDQKRLVPDAEDKLCESLRWAGLEWDEGPIVGGPFGPYKQSQRYHIYQDHANQLLKSEDAYRCFCTPQVASSNEQQASYVTSGCYQHCWSIPADESHHRAVGPPQAAFTVRLRHVDRPKRQYRDLVYGNIKRLKRSPGASLTGEADDGAVAADTILMKSDGTPTYHFANVIDDYLMKITHVIRGTEWMASTPLHYDLYHAFGWDPPEFAHVGLLVDQNKAKLSKRGDAGLVLDVQGMRIKEGVLPVTLCNFLALLGWSNPTKNDVMNMAELIQNFDLKFTKGNTIVRNEKLWFLQKAHVARLCDEAIAKPDSSQHDLDEEVNQIVASMSDNAVRLRDDPTRSLVNTWNAPMDGRSLFVYCKKVLLVDKKAYHRSEQFTKRNEYFFSFDPTLVPDIPSEPDSDVTYSDLHALAGRLLECKSFQEAFNEPDRNDLVTEAADLHWQLEQTSNLIHTIINQEIFATICRDSTSLRTRNLDLFRDPATVVDDLASRNDDVQPQELLRSYKAWNKAVMRFLRVALSYGRPGPGVGQIMATLGWEECQRRIEHLLRSHNIT